MKQDQIDQIMQTDNFRLLAEYSAALRYLVTKEFAGRGFDRNYIRELEKKNFIGEVILRRMEKSTSTEIVY